MYTKAIIFNLALGMLLLQRRITNTDTDPSNEAKVLNTNYDIAFNSVLEALDLDSTATQETLALLEECPDDWPEWGFVYSYPETCAFLRRIKSLQRLDNATTRIPVAVKMFDGQKAIFTDEEDAVAEFIGNDVPLTSLSAAAGLCIACRLAWLSAPLIVGKGADKLRGDLEKRFMLLKGEAQEMDRKENFNFDDPEQNSDFVEARLE